MNLASAMIPQKIHYSWFGGGPKTQLVENCLASFKRYCPEFEIVEWNESNFDIARYPFALHAAHNKKWAFVSDVCRAVVMREHGGFFLDADNELTANIQSFRGYEFVSGFESYEGVTYPITAFMGSQPEGQIACFMSNFYTNMKIFKFEPNTLFIGNYLVKEKGFIPDNTLQIFDNNLIAPSWYFCAPVAGRPSYCIHHFNGSWLRS